MIFEGEAQKVPGNKVQEKARKILKYLDSADNLLALRALGYPAEKKKGKIKGLRGYPNDWYSMDVNKQYRIVFTWRNGKADNVIFIDYH